MSIKKSSVVLAWLFLVCGILFTTYTYGWHGKCYLDSDQSSEMVLADFLNEIDGGLVTDSWYYSTEIRVIYVHLLYRILLPLFPSWHAVRVVSVMVICIILANSIVYFGRKAGLKTGAVWLAGIYMYPFSGDYAYLILYGQSYVTYFIFCFIILGLILQWLKESDKNRKIILFVILALVSFLSGLNGIRQLLVLFFPLLLASIVLLWGKLDTFPMKAFFRTKEFLLALVVMSTTACGSCGFLYNAYFLQKYCHSYDIRHIPLGEIFVSELLDYIG
ncbi:MAG: hypothetical protein J6I56_06650, partial [Lachnospiraceae bacterium]|nr:hypothetical protein [Lachnospiraceae bacterium]